MGKAVGGEGEMVVEKEGRERGRGTDGRGCHKRWVRGLNGEERQYLWEVLLLSCEIELVVLEGKPRPLFRFGCSGVHTRRGRGREMTLDVALTIKISLMAV